MRKTWISLMLVLCLVATCLSGFAMAETTYPLNAEGVTIEWWLPLNANLAASAADVNEAPFGEALEKALGVDIEFIHPTTGAETEAFNLILAGNDLPDIFEANWPARYNGGYEAAMANGYVLDLAPYVDLMPNYTAALNGNETWKLAAWTPKGALPAFMFIRGDQYLQVYAGMIIRQDWLDKLGMEVPKTIDQWTEMLIRFRDELGATTPLITRGGVPDVLSCDAFLGAYGASSAFNNSFYVDEGVVKYGRGGDAWKQTLELFAGWYAEGLFTDTFVTDTGADKNAHVLNGDGGAFYGLTGSGMGTFMNNAAAAGLTEFNLVGAPYPVLNEGDYPEFGFIDNAISGDGTTVNPASEHVELCIKMLDWGYSEAGTMLYNFGTEGVNYEMVDGFPTWNDTVLKNETGISIGQAIARVARSSYGGPFIQAKEYQLQYLQLEQQKNAVATWQQTNIANHKLPNVVVAEADADEFNTIMTEINTFVSEYTALAIDGTYDLAAYEDEYVAVLEDIGIARATEIMQAAYDAYINR